MPRRNRNAAVPYTPGKLPRLLGLRWSTEWALIGDFDALDHPPLDAAIGAASVAPKKANGRPWQDDRSNADPSDPERPHDRN